MKLMYCYLFAILFEVEFELIFEHLEIVFRLKWSYSLAILFEFIDTNFELKFILQHLKIEFRLKWNWFFVKNLIEWSKFD